jgi:ParB family transcriptional regulator, chromosome partitioning protein
MRRGGLGRGLSALIPGADQAARPTGDGSGADASRARLLELPIDEVRANPRQPRKFFSDESLRALAASIAQVGLLQPVVVRRGWGGRGYELVAGERRVRAAALAGLGTVPAVVRPDGDGHGLQEALIENIHREELAPLELAAAFQELLEDLGATQDEVAGKLGCSRAHVANTIRLLSLPSDVQRLIGENRIQAGHARALLGLPDDQARSALGLRIAAEGLSVRQVEDLVRHYSGPRLVRRAAQPEQPGVEEVEEALVERLGTRVRVTMGKRRGRIVIDVGSSDELERITALICGREVISVPEAATESEPSKAGVRLTSTGER